MDAVGTVKISSNSPMFNVHGATGYPRGEKHKDILHFQIQKAVWRSESLSMYRNAGKLYVLQ